MCVCVVVCDSVLKLECSVLVRGCVKVFRIPVALHLGMNLFDFLVDRRFDFREKYLQSTENRCMMWANGNCGNVGIRLK